MKFSFEEKGAVCRDMHKNLNCTCIGFNISLIICPDFKCEHSNVTRFELIEPHEQPGNMAFDKYLMNIWKICDENS